MLKKYKELFIITNILLFIVFIILSPNLVKSSISSSLNIFINILFPSLFPIFLLVNILIEYNFVITISNYSKKIMNKLFHISGNSSYIILTSMISGFPSGAKYISNLLKKNLISVDEANYLICFTHFSNPLFILGVVSLLFDNNSITILILFSHFISNFIIAFIIRPKKIIENNHIILKNNDNSFSNILNTSLKSTYDVMLLILGSTIFAFLIISIITNVFEFNNVSKVIVSGLFDLTIGITSLENVISDDLIKGILTLTFLSFGSLSVHMQVSSIIANTKIKYRNFLLGRICQVAISILIFIILYLL